MRVLSEIKKRIVPGGSKLRRILTGPCRGLSMNLDLQHQTLMWLGLYEKELHPSLELLSKEIKTGIDIGTAEGYYSLFMLGKTGAKKVFSFEPLPESREMFARNLAPSFSSRSELSAKLVSEKDSPDSVSLDSLAGGIEQPCLIKMDVEGAEGSILKGASRILTLPDVRWIIEVHSKPLEDECIQILQNAGYKVTIISPAWWRVIIPEQRTGHNRWISAVR